MKKLWLIICVSLLLAACGGNAGTGTETSSSKSGLQVKIDGKEVPLEVKSSWEMTQDYTSYSEPNSPTTALFEFAIRNYAYDKPNGAITVSNEKLTAPGQALVFIKLYGDKATTNAKSPVKVASYPGDGNMSTSLDRVLIYLYGEGKDDLSIVEFGPSSPANKGELKISSVTADTVAGEIDASGTFNGKNISVKGPFTAKIYVPGK